jgi:hypothetical protein
MRFKSHYWRKRRRIKDARGLSWKKTVEREKRVKKWRRIEREGFGLFCFVSLSLSFYLVGVTGCACVFRVRERKRDRERVWNSEPKRSPNLNLSDVSRADFFVVLFSCFAYPTFYLTRLLPVPYYMYSLISCSKKLEIKSLRKYR